MSLGRQCRSREGGDSADTRNREQTELTRVNKSSASPVYLPGCVTAFLPTECQPLTPVNTLDGA
jgi:hypothetical protein